MQRLCVVLAAIGMVTGCGEGSATLSDELEGWLEPDTGLVVVDSDVLGGNDEASARAGLTVARIGARDDLWPAREKRALRYCIDRSSFGPWAKAVESAMQQATADWEQSANVRFEHVSREDQTCSRANEAVVFNVRRVSGRPYLARSFFPSSERLKREILVDSSALPPGTPLSLGGVLRHELGHVLGLRHEHTRSRDNPCFEDSRWRAVTPYDQRSVMHYPQCAGVGGRDLTLTTRDRQGIAELYP